MATTLTREAFLEKGKPEYREVEVPGWGVVGFRAISNLQVSKRQGQMIDEKGKVKADVFALRDAFAIIDQVMVDENTPMFTSNDADLIANMDDVKLQPLLEALASFRNEVSPQKKIESEDSSES